MLCICIVFSALKCCLYFLFAYMQLQCAFHHMEFYFHKIDFQPSTPPHSLGRGELKPKFKSKVYSSLILSTYILFSPKIVSKFCKHDNQCAGISKILARASVLQAAPFWQSTGNTVSGGFHNFFRFVLFPFLCFSIVPFSHRSSAPIITESHVLFSEK